MFIMLTRTHERIAANYERRLEKEAECARKVRLALKKTFDNHADALDKQKADLEEGKRISLEAVRVSLTRERDAFKGQFDKTEKTLCEAERQRDDAVAATVEAKRRHAITISALEEGKAGRERLARELKELGGLCAARLEANDSLVAGIKSLLAEHSDLP